MLLLPANSTAVNRTFKVRIFEMVFSNKKDLPELYNAVSGTDYDDPNLLEINTLETGRKEVSPLNQKSMFLSITLGAASFKKFAVFNIMNYQKRWKTPVAIGVTGFIASIISFSLQDTFENAFLLGVLLFVVGIFIPGMYFKTFFQSVKEQTEKMNLEKPRHVYSIELTDAPDGIRFYHPNEKKAAGQFSWNNITGAWRTDKAIYLYVEQNRALLIPDTTKNVTQDEVWKFLQKQAGADRMHDTRKKH